MRTAAVNECQMFRAFVIAEAPPAVENDAVAAPAAEPPSAADAAAGVIPLFCFSMMTAGRPVILVLFQIDTEAKFPP